MRKLISIIGIVLFSKSLFALTAAVINSTNPTCWGGPCNGTVTFSVTGTAPFSINKSDCSGNNYYQFWTSTFTVTGLCYCAGNTSFYIWDNAAPQGIGINISLVNPPQTWITNNMFPASCSSCCDGSASFTLTGGSPGFQYQLDNGAWSPSPPNYSSLCVGTHTFCAKDSKNCINCDYINIGFSTSTNNNFADQIYCAFTNPVDRNLEIIAIEFPIEVSFLTYDGKLVRTVRNVERGTIDTSDLPQDLYFLQIKSDSNYIIRKLVVIHN